MSRVLANKLSIAGIALRVESRAGSARSLPSFTRRSRVALFRARRHEDNLGSHHGRLPSAHRPGGELFLVRLRVNPNAITTFGTHLYGRRPALSFALGHIMTAGWIIGLTALFDVLDGTVARRTGRRRYSARSTTRRSTGSPTARHGRPRRLLRDHRGAPQYYHAGRSLCSASSEPFSSVHAREGRSARHRCEGRRHAAARARRAIIRPTGFFRPGFCNGWVLDGDASCFSLTAWITAVQRIAFVRATTHAHEASSRPQCQVIARQRRNSARGVHNPNGWRIKICRQIAEVRTPPAPATGKLGILTPGLGAVATTFMAGVESIRRGLLEADRLAHPDGDDPARQAHRKSVAADQGFRSSRRSGRHRVRRLGSDSRRCV